jgi:hypothetical protein
VPHALPPALFPASTQPRAFAPVKRGRIAMLDARPHGCVVPIHIPLKVSGRAALTQSCKQWKHFEIVGKFFLTACDTTPAFSTLRNEASSNNDLTQ